MVAASSSIMSLEPTIQRHLRDYFWVADNKPHAGAWPPVCHPTLGLIWPCVVFSLLFAPTPLSHPPFHQPPSSTAPATPSPSTHLHRPLPCPGARLGLPPPRTPPSSHLAASHTPLSLNSPSSNHGHLPAVRRWLGLWLDYRSRSLASLELGTPQRCPEHRQRRVDGPGWWTREGRQGRPQAHRCPVSRPP